MPVLFPRARKSDGHVAGARDLLSEYVEITLNAGAGTLKAVSSLS